MEGLVNKKPIPKNPINRTPPDIVEKIVYLRQAYDLGPIRIVWYLARYHDIKISGAEVYRVAPGFAKSIPFVTRNKFRAIRFRLTLSF